PDLPRGASSGHCPPFCTKERTKVSAFVSSTESISSSRSSAAWAEAKVCPPVTASAPCSSSGPEPGAFRDCWDMGSSSYRWGLSTGADGPVQRLEDRLGVVGGIDAVLGAPVGRAQARVGQAQPVPAGGPGQGNRIPSGGGHPVPVRGDQAAAQVGAGAAGGSAHGPVHLLLAHQGGHGAGRAQPVVE